MKPPEKALPDSFVPTHRTAKVFTIALAGVVIGATLLVLSSWGFGFPAFAKVTLHIETVNPTASLCILLTGVCTLLFSFRSPGFNWRLVYTIAGIILITQGVARLLGVVGYDPRLDTILFYREFEEVRNGLMIGRMTYVAALVFVLFGAVLLLKAQGNKKPVLTESLVLLVIAISLFNIISVIYGVENVYFGPWAMYKLRLGAALCCLLISMIFLVQDSDKGMMRIITSKDPGGRMATIFLPLALVFPVLLGVIDRFADSSGWFQDAFGLALFSILSMMVFFVVILRTAKANNNLYGQLLAEISEREKASKEAYNSDLFANTIYESIPHMVFVKDGAELSFRSINKAGERLLGMTREELIGKTDHDFFPKEEADFFRKKDRDVFTSPVPVIVEEPITTRSYGVRWLRTKKIGVKNEKGEPLYMIGISEDITELKEKQEQLNRYNEELEKEIEKRTKELKRSEERYQQMVEDVLDYSILLINKDGMIMNWNKGAERMKGYKQDEIIGKSFKTFYNDQDVKEGVPDKFLERAKNTGRASHEGWRIRKDGQMFWAITAITALYDEKGEILGFSKVTRDMTERRQAEQNLKESQQQFEAFMRTLPAMAWIVDEKGIFHYVNSLYQRVFNLHDLVGKSFHDIFPVDIADEYQRNNEIVFKSDIVLEVTEPSIKSDGTKAILKVFKFPLGVKNGKKLLGGIALDITQMVETEKALKQANEQINLFVRHTPAAVAMFDSQMRYMVASDRWYSDYGLQGQQILGKSHYDVFPEIKEMPEWNDIHKRCLAGAIEKREKDLFLRSDGVADWLRWEIHPWKMVNGETGGIIMFTEVITDRVNAEESLRKLNEQLSISNKELEQFAFVASHDLQEPLRMISSFLQLLEMKYKNKIDETANQYISFAVDASERMKAFITDLLKYSKMGGNDELFAGVDCNKIVEDVLKSCSNMIEECAAVVHVPSLPVIRGRVTQIEQLFLNLLSNAIKYRGEEPPRIYIGAEEMEKEWKFFVKDNGIGIDNKYLEKIFVIFQRLHNKKDYSGTGIGLAICKKIVEQHGGKIWLTSVPGEGSTFYFTISKNN